MRIGVDVGGTKIAVAAATPEGRIVARARGATTDRAVETIVDLVRQVRSPGLRGLGVSVPGLVSADGETVLFAPNIPGWDGLPLKKRLESALDLPVVLGYDGHAALLGEAWLGAARGLRHVVMLVIGTGIGGAAIADGRLVRGRDGIAGAAGWIAEPDGPLETFASGRAIRDWDDAHLRIGRACASLVSFLNPERVILGGGAGLRFDCGRVRAILRERAQPQAAANCDVVHATLGEDAGVLGAMRFLEV